MIREIRYGDSLVALHIVHDVTGTMPASDPTWPLQMLMIERTKGSVFPRHAHTPIDRHGATLQEALVVLSGKIRMTILTRSGDEVETFDVDASECVFLVEGGWGIEVLEDARMYEFKNGPHHDDKVAL